MLSFIIFEIAAQAYLVLTFYSFKNKLKNYINQKYLKIKINPCFYVGCNSNN